MTRTSGKKWSFYQRSSHGNTGGAAKIQTSGGGLSVIGTMIGFTPQIYIYIDEKQQEPVDRKIK